MPADHRSNSRRASGNRHPLIMGLVIGLVLGVGLSVAVAIWLKGFANPFLAQPKAVEPLPKSAARAPKAEERPEDKAKADKPRFEFYTVLPGDKGGSDTSPAPRAPAAPPKEAPPKAAESAPAKEAVAEPAKEAPKSAPEPPKAPAESLWLQAGAFADPKDAENMRVQIALSGLEASVKVADVPGRGRLHRVRVGPFATVSEANRVKASLSQNGITTTLIRTEESR